MTAYYNENDPKAAAWLCELIKAGHIAPGDVDTRSIEDVTPLDVAGYTQCHFFAGIGGWSYALRLTNWSDSRRVWTGSCPCQPFSNAGKGGGFADERHLWPTWHHLIDECRPPVLFGEQVASKDGLNWFDLVHTDLEISDYAVGVADLCAASVGAPHIRQRLYWVADAIGERRARVNTLLRAENNRRVAEEAVLEVAGSSKVSVVGDAQGERRQGILAERETLVGQRARPWSASELIPCTDGKTRPIEPGTFPLAHGVPHRVGLLRGYGNAIVAPQAAEFIKAYCEC